MTKTTELSEIEAIEQVISEGVAMDYIDVVNEVEKRYRIKTSSAMVEQVHHGMAKARTDDKQRIKPNLSLQMTSKLPRMTTQPAAKAEPSSSEIGADTSSDATTLALQFVKSVGGLKKAKLALQELESILNA